MMRRVAQCTNKFRRGLRQSLLKDRSSLKPEAAADPDAVIPKTTTVRTARGWAYTKQLRKKLERKQINVVRANREH